MVSLIDMVCMYSVKKRSHTQKSDSFFALVAGFLWLDKLGKFQLHQIAFVGNKEKPSLITASFTEIVPFYLVLTYYVVRLYKANYFFEKQFIKVEIFLLKGLAALHNYQVIIRQTFYHGCYALIGEDLYPNPDFWLSALYKTLVSDKVSAVHSVEI